MKERPFYDFTKDAAPEPVGEASLPTHDIEIYELDGAVHIVIKKEDFAYEVQKSISG